MQKHIGPIIVTALVFGFAADATAQNGQIQGFGGMTLRGVTPSTTVGGSLAVSLTDHIQVIAEGGRSYLYAPVFRGHLTATGVFCLTGERGDGGERIAET